MNPALWRSVELQLPNGAIAVDVEGSGRRTQHFVVHEIGSVSTAILTVQQLADVFRATQVDVEHLAATHPVGLGYTVCVLAGRPYSILGAGRMQWSDLEEHFGLDRTANRPRVEDGCLKFLVCSHYSPMIEIRSLGVNLQSWEVWDEVLIHTPWPPARVPVAV